MSSSPSNNEAVSQDAMENADPNNDEDDEEEDMDELFSFGVADVASSADDDDPHPTVVLSRTASSSSATSPSHATSHSVLSPASSSTHSNPLLAASGSSPHAPSSLSPPTTTRIGTGSGLSPPRPRKDTSDSFLDMLNASSSMSSPTHYRYDNDPQEDEETPRNEEPPPQQPSFLSIPPNNNNNSHSEKSLLSFRPGSGRVDHPDNNHNTLWNHNSTPTTLPSSSLDPSQPPSEFDDETQDLLDWLSESGTTKPSTTTSTKDTTATNPNHNHKTNDSSSQSVQSPSRDTPEEEDNDDDKNNSKTGARKAPWASLLPQRSQDKETDHNQTPTLDNDNDNNDTTQELPSTALVSTPPSPPLPESLPLALASSETSVSQIRQLAIGTKLVPRSSSGSTTNTTTPPPLDDDNVNKTLSEWMTEQPSLRSELYCRLVCGNKSLAHIQSSSLADAFSSWDFASSTVAHTWIPVATRYCLETMPPLEQPQLQGSVHDTLQQDLMKLLAYHSNNNQHKDNNSSSLSSSSSNSSMDVLIPCVARVLLAAGIPVAAASVVLGQVQAQVMPLLALDPNEERWEAALSLHHALYLLAAYHLPLLVVHLDRHLPGWFAPQQQPQQQSTEPSGGPTPTTKATRESSASLLLTNATERARHWEKQGQIPPSWLLSFLSGQVVLPTEEQENPEGPLASETSKDSSASLSSSSSLPLSQILHLWDIQLVAERSQQALLRYFLTLAVLERAADELILVTGHELQHQLQQAFALSRMTNTHDDDDDNADDADEMNLDRWFHYGWLLAARALWRATPITVLERLVTAEDEAVQTALQVRQARAEAALKARLQAEAAAHARQQEAKAEQARQRLTRARLVAFYRKHAPEKEANIDKILSNYASRLEILDAKLFKKYGESFEPALGNNNQGTLTKNKLSGQQRATSTSTTEHGKKPPLPQPHKRSKSLLGLGGRKKSATMEDETQDDADDEHETAGSNPFLSKASRVNRKPDQVAVFVAAKEVLPVVCGCTYGPRQRRRQRSAGTKEGKQETPNHDSVTVQCHLDDGSSQFDLEPLKYFLVDSRSEEAASEQGRFPTAVTLSPEAMLDPDRIAEFEERLESLRGAVHIVIMGEGFSAIPTLYKQQKLSPKLEAAMVQDESRTNICALFFLKKGFPFVSVLEGGFASAHAWLVRHGQEEQYNLKAANVLVDYNPEASVFGQMETLHNASVSEKAQRQLANLLESSLVAMTMQAQNLEKLTAEKNPKAGTSANNNNTGGGGGGLRLGAFFKSSAQVNAPQPDNTKSSTTQPSELAAAIESVSSTEDPKEKDSEAVKASGSDDNHSTGSESNNKGKEPDQQQPPPRMGGFLSNPFGRGKAAATAASTEDGAANPKSPSSTPPRKQSPAPTRSPTASDNTSNSSSSDKNQKDHDASTDEPTKTIDSSSSSSSKAADSNTSTTTTTSTNAPSGGGGMGGLLKRNPFRFGSGGKIKNTSQHGGSKIKNTSQHGGNSSVHGPSNNNNNKQQRHGRNKSVTAGGFASLNNLRKSALGRIRSAPGGGSMPDHSNHSVGKGTAAASLKRTTSKDNEEDQEEESISFE